MFVALAVNFDEVLFIYCEYGSIFHGCKCHNLLVRQTTIVRFLNSYDIMTEGTKKLNDKARKLLISVESS